MLVVRYGHHSVWISEHARESSADTLALATVHPILLEVLIHHGPSCHLLVGVVVLVLVVIHLAIVVAELVIMILPLRLSELAPEGLVACVSGLLARGLGRHTQPCTIAHYEIIGFENKIIFKSH